MCQNTAYIPAIASCDLLKVDGLSNIIILVGSFPPLDQCREREEPTFLDLIDIPCCYVI